MKINKLSNFLLIFTILTNIGFSQIEDLKNSGLIEKSCKQDNGPWFFQYNNDVINETPELLSEDEISVITEDGVVVFCEGESNFSGLFTANELVLYGSGNVEDVMVSPIDYKYFNLVSLDMEELIEFIDFHDYDSLNKLNIKNIEIDNESNITILNTTFTQGDFIKKSTQFLKILIFYFQILIVLYFHQILMIQKTLMLILVIAFQILNL